MRNVSFALVTALVTALAPFAARADNLWIERPSAPKVQIPSLAPLVKDVEPAVLSIYVEGHLQPQIDPNDPRFDFFRRFGLNLEQPDARMQGQGTGFIISPDGYALTNHHVVENAEKIQVRVDGSQQLINATVIGDDPRSDIALIKLDGNRHDWPAVPLGDSDVLQVGDFVVAIGNPFGLSQSVSMGIVSAKGRREVAPEGRKGLYDFIQTDASINPGNSGGPLLNVNGEVIGINSAISATGQGIGFAIPINMVKREVPELRKSGKVARAWIGVAIQKVDPEVAKGLGLDHAHGALVASVVDKSPGYKAGLKPGDVIVKFDGKTIEDASDLPLLASTEGVQKTVSMELVRDGELRSAKVTLAAMPEDDDKGAARAAPSAERENPGKIGVRVDNLDNLDDNYRQKLDLDANARGAVIVNVDPNGAAGQAGLAMGDVIREVNGNTVSDARAFVKALDKVPTGKLVKLLVNRHGIETFVAFMK
ncbi:MAG TPA: Do family serine endopeptidase, partial [Myxococcota bacterium]